MQTRTPSQPAAGALRPSKDSKPSYKAIRKIMREISYRAARMAIRPRKATRKVRRNVKREATAEQEIKQEHELTLEERRAAEKELADVLRRISRTDGNFVKLEADE
jgi:D-aminopeptidase